MNQKEFNYYVEQHIRDFLPEEERDNSFVCVHPIRKTNDIVRQGCLIRRGNEKISPVIYLDDAWEAYKEGKEIDDVLKDLVEIYQEHQQMPNLDESMDYESIKDKIVSFVVGKETNQNNLKHRVYSDVGNGLAEVYDIRKDLGAPDEIGSIAITHGLMRKYGYDMREIIEAAKENTPRYFPAKLETLLQTLLGGERDEFQNPEPNTDDVFMLSNSEGFQGAEVLFYPGMQKRIAEHFGKNYYVLPSSLHELLILPERDELIPAKLEEMVKSVNRTSVESKDFLSDKVLYYDREKELLRYAIPDEPQQNKAQKKTWEAR